MTKDPIMNIGDVVNIVGCHPQTIRGLEREGVFVDLPYRSEERKVSVRKFSLEQLWRITRILHITRLFRCPYPAAVFILRLMQECEDLREELEKCKEKQ